MFVNRNVYLSHINCFGFDMDYTLAGINTCVFIKLEYKSENLDHLIFNFAKRNLVEIGYPEVF